MGSSTRGPVPKRSTQRRRRNKESQPEKVEVSGTVKAPSGSKDWHPVAKRWFRSLRDSGQSQFYEPSDWASAFLIAESMSRDLSPQWVAVTEKGDSVYETIPLKGASLSAYLKAMSVLMVTEGDRRRMRLELVRDGNPEPTEESEVTALDDFRRRIST